MYPNPNPNPNGGSGRQQLTRYSSAPSSVFDSSDVFLGIYSSSSSSQPNSTTANIPSFGVPPTGGVTSNPTTRGVSSSSTSMHHPLPPPSSSSSSSLTRHNSSPAGFLTQLAASNSGFTLTNGGYGNMEAARLSHGAQKPSRFGTQLNFTKQQPQESSSSLKRAGSLQLQSTSFDFSGSSSKRGKMMDEEGIDLLSSFSDIDSQVDNMMNIPENSVACKTRAKRGFATHPRSIAERDRRTRISGRLKKLQELVPNMDKQTSYSEMLDLAIQHIQGLQFQIQKLNEDASNCMCGCNPKN